MAVKKNKGSEYLLGPLWENIRYSVFGGIRKNLHLPYYIHGFGMLAKPRWITEKKLGSLLQEFDKSSSQEQDYIMDRVNYYNRLSQPINIPVDSPTIGEQSYFKKKCPSVCSQSVRHFVSINKNESKTSTYDISRVCKFFN